jgi:hypothetical protein
MDKYVLRMKEREREREREGAIELAQKKRQPHHHQKISFV